MRIGVLTAGGDAPGLNAAIRAIGEMAHSRRPRGIGIANGGPDSSATSTGDPAREAGPARRDRPGRDAARHRALQPRQPRGRPRRSRTPSTSTSTRSIAIGGDGTQRIATGSPSAGRRSSAYPRPSTTTSPGPTTASASTPRSASSPSRSTGCYTTAASHHRVIVVETMGRATGWVAALGGLAGGADMIVIPEFPITMDEIVNHLIADAPRACVTRSWSWPRV